MARERDRPDVQEKVAAFSARQASLDPAKLVFLDETGFRLGSSPRFGWAPSGADAIGLCTQGQWKTMTLIGAIATDGFRASMTVDAGTGADVMLAFTEQLLVPSLNPGDIVIMDNLAGHKINAVVQAIEGAGAEVLYTPPYHPEFNPIEKTWAKLKDLIRRWNTLTRIDFDDSVAKAIELISKDNIAAWMAHAGYSIC